MITKFIWIQTVNNYIILFTLSNDDDGDNVSGDDVVSVDDEYDGEVTM